MRLILALALTLSLTTLALAHSGVRNAAVMERMEAMLSSKKAIERLVAMVKGEVPFERKAAGEARKALIANTKATPTLFREPHADPKTEALPIIWENWADFERKNRATVRAARAMDVSSLQAMQPGLLKLGTTCLACHQTYRKIKD